MKDSSARTKMNEKKRKKSLDKQNPESKPRTKKRKETAKDRMLKLNSFYSNGNFGIWIQCTNCNKWRNVMEYEEDHEVPQNWTCSMSLSGSRNCDEPENTENTVFSPVNFIPGTIVWAKYKGYPWWPGMIEDDPNIEEYYWQDDNGKWHYNVTFLDDKVTRAWVAASSVRSFFDRPKQSKHLFASYAKYSRLLAEAESKAETAMNMTVQERLEKFSFAHQFKGKWGSPLPSDDSDEDDEDEKEENEKNLTQILLEEINDIESIHSADSDNESAISLKQQKSETNHEISSKTDFEQMKNKRERKLLTGACFSQERKQTKEKDSITYLKTQSDEVNETDNESYREISSKSNSAYDEKSEKKRKKLLTEAHPSKESNLTNQEDNVAHLKIQDDETNETDNEPVHEISSKSDSAYEKRGKIRKKLLSSTHSSKKRKLTDEEDNVAYTKRENEEVNKTEIDKDAKTFSLAKGNKGKSTHKKPMNKKLKDMITSLKGEDENKKCDSKIKKGNNKMRIPKVKNENVNKLENLEEKIDDAEEIRSSIKKTDSKDIKTSNENKEENHKETTLNQYSCSKFRPPLKNTENSESKDNQSSKIMNKKSVADINLCNVGSIIKEENLVKKEKAEKNLGKNKQWEASITEKNMNSKNSENSQPIEKNTKNENEFEENIVKTLEKNLKISLENMQMEKNNEPTSNDNSSTTFQEIIKTENNSKESKKNGKMNHLKEEFSNSETQNNKKYSIKNKSIASNPKENIRNIMKVDLLTETLPISSEGKSKRTDAFKIPTKQNISEKEKKVMKDLKTVKKTEEVQNQDDGIAYAKDDEVQDISCDEYQEEIISLVKMNLDEIEEEDSDPFEFSF